MVYPDGWLPRRKERVKHRASQGAQAWGLLITCHLNYHEHKKRGVRVDCTPKSMGTLQVTKARADGPQHCSLHLLPPHSRHITATITNTHELQLFSSMVCASLLQELFSESMTPQAYFLLKIYTKTKHRATKYSRRSPGGDCCFCRCTGFVLSTHPMHQTKPSPGMIYPYRNLQGGASGQLLFIMDRFLNVIRRSLS